MSHSRARYCPIVGCANFRGTGDLCVRFFTVSKADDPLLLEKWVESIRTYMPDFPDISRFRICSLHFNPEDLILIRGQHQLKSGAIPTRFPFEATKMKQENVPGVPVSLKRIKIIRAPNGFIKRPQLVQDPLRICSKCEDYKAQTQIMKKKMHEFQEQIKEQQFEITALHKRTEYLKEFEPSTVRRTEECTVCEMKLTTEELYLHMCQQQDISDIIRCEYCSKSYNSTIKLLNHLRVSHNENPDKTFYHCDNCPKIFEMAQLLGIHEKTHPDVKPEILCEKCFHKFFTQFEYDKHMRTQHPAADSLLDKHMSEKHESARPSTFKASWQSEKKTAKIVFECYMCEKATFQSFRNVKLHLKEHGIPSIGKCLVCWTKMYTSELEMHLCKSAAQADDDDDGVDRFIDCEYCPEKFQAITKLFRHIDDKHATAKILYRCINCPNTYPVKCLLEYHNVVHTHGIFKCNQCSKNRSFETLTALNMHIKRHESQEVHLCDICGSALKSRRNLHIHKLTHSNKKPIKCHLCPKKFSINSQLRKHLNFHSKQLFSCHLCDFKCTASDRLGIHIKRHTHPKEKRFECSMCTFKATEQNRLNQHMSAVHTTIRQHHCSHCTRSYKHKGDLTKHLRTHLGDYMYACPESGCSERFRLQLDLKKHASVHYVEGKIMETDT